MIRRIRDLLYDQGFTISGARNRLQELSHVERENAAPMPTLTMRLMAQRVMLNTAPLQHRQWTLALCWIDRGASRIVGDKGVSFLRKVILYII